MESKWFGSSNDFSRWYPPHTRMNLEKLIESFTFADIEPLVIEFYPETKEYLPIYLETFGTLICLIPRYGNVIRLIDVEDDPSYIYLFDKNGAMLFDISLNDWLGCEIDYKTMEHYEDKEIFIRCLHAIIWHKIVTSELKKKGKNPKR